MGKKKVLMVHNFYQIGGGEHTVFKNEVELLRENGHEVIEYTRSNDELKSSKLKLVLLPLTTIWSWKTFWEVRRIIKKEKIDIVHCHNTFPLISPSVYYAARSMNVPVIQTIHNFRFLCPNGSFFCNGKVCEKCYEKNSFKDAIKNNCYRNSKIQTLVLVAMLKFHRCIGTYKKISYIFLTDFNRRKFDKLIDINSDQVFIKPNFVKEPDKSHLVPAYRQFVYAGRLEQNKGIMTLLEMWKELPKSYVLAIYGTGTLEELVQTKANEQQNIKFFGFRNQNDLFDAYDKSIAVVIPSEWYETFGMGIPECFSRGVPVICTDIGNPGEMIKQSKGGEVYPEGDFIKFKEALDKVSAHREEYSKNAYSYYNRYLNDKNNYYIVQDIYEKAGGIDDYIFIYAGRLEKIKGIIRLVKMWKFFPNQYKLHIYGDGPDKEELLDCIKDTENITYFGFVSKKVLDSAYRKSTASIISSECYETFGMGIPECFSLGVPVIATSIGNPGSMVLESKAGLVYEIDDAKGLFNSIIQIVSNRKIYSKNASKYFEEKLNEKINYSELIEIYDKTRPIK